MSLFSRRLIIEANYPAVDALKRLMIEVRTNQPFCRNCGQLLAGFVTVNYLCPHCGGLVPGRTPSRGSWLVRAITWPSNEGFEFEGSVSPHGFRITRLISYRNSCLPVITGRFETVGSGTRIVVEMEMHPLGYVLLSGGIGIPLLVFSAIASDSADGYWLAIPALVMPCIFFLICWLAFRYEANIATAAMNRIFRSV